MLWCLFCLTLYLSPNRRVLCLCDLADEYFTWSKKMARTKQSLRLDQRKSNYLQQILSVKRQQLKNSLTTGGVKKAKRFRPGNKSLSEIRKYQRTTDSLIPKTTFQRLVKEVALSINEGLRLQSAAIGALQVKHFVITDSGQK